MHRSTHRSPRVRLASGPFLPAWSIVLFGSRQAGAERILMGRQLQSIPRKEGRTPRGPPPARSPVSLTSLPSGCSSQSPSAPPLLRCLSVHHRRPLPATGERAGGEPRGPRNGPGALSGLQDLGRTIYGYENGTVIKEIGGGTQTLLQNISKLSKSVM